LRQDLTPILAYQAKAFKQTPGPKQIENVAAWWDTVATRLKDRSPRLAFDILIEPTEAVNKDPVALNAMYEASVTAIRRTNPTRNLFIAPRVRSNPAYLSELKWPSKANRHVLAEWHFYASGPSKTNPEKLWTTGSAAERGLIEAKLKHALEWQRKTGHFSWVGAWMAGNYNDGDDYSIAEQVKFATFVSCTLRAGNIAYAVNSDAKFFDRDRNRWYPEMRPVLDALIEPKCKT
jgi:Cellulase (glycosyl hydrolase family 5)